MTVIDLTFHDTPLTREAHHLLPLEWSRSKRRVVATCSCGDVVSRHRPEDPESIDRMKAAFVRHVLGI